MDAQALFSHDSHLVLFSSTHVMFLKKNEQRLAEAFRNRDAHFRNGIIEPIKSIPSGVQLGKVYRHYSPAEKKPFS